MKFRYTFAKPDKTITVCMFLNTMFIYKKYIKSGYIAVKKEVFINGKWVDVNDLVAILTKEII